jgi:cysteine-rich repeat protein
MAGRDITVTAPVDVVGGDFDGGTIDLYGERDVLVQSNLNLSSRSGAGYGGELDLTADRDIFVGSSTRPIRILANGHTDHIDDGDGGYIDFDAIRDIHVAPNVRIVALGAMGYAFGGSIYFVADGDLDFAGRFDGRARNVLGVGGVLQAEVDGNVHIAETADLDLRGGTGGFAELFVENGDVTFAGRLRLNGDGNSEEGFFDLYTCRMTFSGRIENNVKGGLTRISAYESMHLLPGSELLTPKGETFLAYRAAEKPPVLEGTIVATPILALQPYLSGCPVCGNAEIDEGETCDDGNIDDGDGCSSDCLVE